MLACDAGFLAPPDAVAAAVAAMSLSTLSRAVFWVQISRGIRRCLKGMGAKSLNRRLLALLLTSMVALMMILARILCICLGPWYVLEHASGMYVCICWYISANSILKIIILSNAATCQRKKSNLKKCGEEFQLRVGGDGVVQCREVAVQAGDGVGGRRLELWRLKADNFEVKGEGSQLFV
ncbi:uncharacterized protein LOC119284002 [Triticum dicoccoides]|uniref:uncharacterized protein LOC119284002 n=1 Tax=Triticum dicoccoides TaxID=85692 RepID=UPI00188FD059|nr:uncharacterized protein LOC119284002 [Triticum dicoccoides]